MSAALIVEPGSGSIHGAFVVKLGARATAGTLALAEATVAPGAGGPPPHRHARTHDIFYVLDGELTLRLDDAEHVLGPGALACVPPGVVHTYRNAGALPVRFLNVTTPAGQERLLAALDHAPPAAVAAAHDVELVG